jgi:hypothetical protein
MDRFTKMNVCVQQHLEEYIDNLERHYYDGEYDFNNPDDFLEFLLNFEDIYFIGDWQVQEFFDEASKKLDTIEYLRMCEEIIEKQYDLLNPCEMSECMNIYIQWYIHEFIDDLFKYYVRFMEEREEEKKCKEEKKCNIDDIAPL